MSSLVVMFFKCRTYQGHVLETLERTLGEWPGGLEDEWECQQNWHEP